MPERVAICIPQETVNDDSVLILSWKFASGARVEKDQLLCEAETSKAVMEIFAPEAGTLVYSAAEGSEVAVGATICEIVPEGAEVSAVPAGPAVEVSKNGAGSEELPLARLTALAFTVAAEHGLDAASFPRGTVVRRDDVLRKVGNLPPVPKRPVAAAAPVSKVAAVSGVEVEWSDLPRRKALEGEFLAAGQAGTISSMVTAICRAPRLRARVAGLGFPAVGLTALAIFETARLLRKYPMFNAVHANRRMGQYGRVNIGWALDGGQKLVVPVIPDADKKSVAEIGTLMQTQLEQYVENALPASSFAGGTFTVTDLSGEGIGFFQPLIGQGQSAILGIGADPADGDGETFYLTLAFDHQLSEGRTAAKFVGELRARLEAHSAAAGVEAAAGEAEPYCQLCQRDSAELKSIRAILLKSEIPAGFVCSLCIVGWL